MSLLAKRLQAARPSETKAMTAKAAALRRAAVDIITLSQGEPDFDTPEAVRRAGVAAIEQGRARYTAVAGGSRCARRSARSSSAIAASTTTSRRSQSAAAPGKSRSTRSSPAFDPGAIADAPASHRGGFGDAVDGPDAVDEIGRGLGHGAGPKDLIKAMNTIQGQTSSHTSSISQYAAFEAIAGDQSLVAKLNAAPGLRCRVPDGAFYVFVSRAGVIGKTTSRGQVIETDTDVTMYLLEQFGVAVVPGSDFMASPYIRISYAASEDDLERATARIQAACEALSESETSDVNSKTLA